jgi:hypothetical protein
MLDGHRVPMSATPPVLSQPSVAESRLPPPKSIEWRSKIRESWPLFFAGVACLFLAAVLGVQRTAGSLTLAAPTFLFLALGIVGIAGGVTSYVVGPDADERPEVVEETVQPSFRSPSPVVPTESGESQVHTPGSPAPRVPPPEWSESSELLPSWMEDQEIPPSTLLDSQMIPRPSQWANGRVLRLSEDGVLTLYTLDDAIRDLELATDTVDGRRTPRRSSIMDADSSPSPGE